VLEEANVDATRVSTSAAQEMFYGADITRGDGGRLSAEIVPYKEKKIRSGGGDGLPGNRMALHGLKHYKTTYLQEKKST
jgi:hypothetical protein